MFIDIVNNKLNVQTLYNGYKKIAQSNYEWAVFNNFVLIDLLNRPINISNIF